MARTPLFGSLRRSLKLATIAQRQRAGTTREFVEHLRAGTSRRTFLKGALGTAALVGIGAPGVGCGGEDEAKAPRIAIVGGGIAGLHCAYRLKAAGVPATIYEASERAGGRMFTARDVFQSGQLAELGGEFIDSNHTVLRTLADELSLGLDDMTLEGPNIRRETFYFDGQVIDEEALIDAFRPVADQMAIAATAGESTATEFARYDNLSIRDWLASLDDASPLIREVLEVAYLGEYGLETDEQSLWNLLYLIDHEMPDPFRIYGESDERYHVHLGSDAIPAGLAAQLTDRLELGHRLTSIETQADGSYRLAFDVIGGGALEKNFDHVVLALPFTLLRDVTMRVELPELKRRAIDEVGYGTNAKLIGQFSSRPWRDPGNASGSSFTDNGAQATWETSRGQEGSLGILTNFLGGQAGLALNEGTPQERMQATLPKLNAIFPGTEAAYLAESAVRMHWPTAPFAKGSYTCYRPGQWEFYGVEGEREGNLHFCGEHTSLDYQGFMEGGAETGARAAMEILSDIGSAASPLLAALVNQPRRRPRFAQAALARRQR